MNDDLERIDDSEFVYRKIPVSQADWYDPDTKAPTSKAFRPHKDRDKSGLSVDRAKSDIHPDFRSPEQSATGNSKLGYFLAVLQVCDLRSHGINIVARREPDNPGHAELTDLRSDNRNTEAALNLTRLLADKLTQEVLGPFNSKT